MLILKSNYDKDDNENNLQASFGLLLEKQSVILDNRKYEFWEYIDFVFGIHFVNEREKPVFNIYSDKYYNMIIPVLNSKSINDSQYMVAIQGINDAVKYAFGDVNFKEFENNASWMFEKYYVYNKLLQSLVPLKDKKVLAYLSNMEQDNKEKADIKNDIVDNKKLSIEVMYKRIKENVISQDEQIKQILTAIYKNQEVINSNIDIGAKLKLKENILVCGPTGTGKTEILKQIASIYDIPIVIEDITSFSEIGYVGRNTSDMLLDLYSEANGDIAKAERGILVIDEFDKLAEFGDNSAQHVSRSGVQRSLLKMLDGSIFWLDKNQKTLGFNSGEKQKFDTSLLTIVCLGAFTGIIDNNIKNMGFGANIDNNNNKSNYQNLTMNDFTKYGIMPELIGRFSKILKMNPLSKEDLKNILLNSKLSPIYMYQSLFDEKNIKFKFNDDFIEWVANEAVLLKSGARSLKSIVDGCLNNALFEIFSGNITEIELVEPKSNNDKAYTLKKSL